MKNIAIILAGGTGKRFGAAVPKQYIQVGGKPIIMYCVETLAGMPEIDRIVICLDDGWKDFVLSYVKSIGITKPILFSRPGEARQLTILNALELLDSQGAEEDDIVIIHEAVRPLTSAELIRRCISGCENADGVMPVLSLKDTIYLSSDHKTITGLLNRSELVAGQAPCAFCFGKYLDSNHQMDEDELRSTSGSGVVGFKKGLHIALVQGEEHNFKITTREDMDLFEYLNELICADHYR